MPRHTLKCEHVEIAFFTAKPLYVGAEAELFIEGLCSVDKFAPTHWCGNSIARPLEIETLVKNLDRYYDQPEFRRTKAPKWKGWGSFDSQCTQLLHVEFDRNLKQQHFPQVFDWGDHLANLVAPDFGVVHLAFPDRRQFVGANAPASIGTGVYEQRGLPLLSARTYFGKRLVDLIGRGAIRETGANYRKFNWGVSLDLCDEPWTQGATILRRLQLACTDNLRPSGLFYTSEKRGRYKPGGNWEPPDVSVQPPKKSRIIKRISRK